MSRRALLSVTDKTGLVEFANKLVELGFEIISTGGTAAALRANSIPITDISTVTGFPEILDGRVKTLHPKVHGGLLGDIRMESHRVAMDAHGIARIELLCVNLYNFADTISKPHSLEEAVESIDIGGPAMIRAAAKNFANTLVIVDPQDYKNAIEILTAGSSEAQRRYFAAKAFRHTAFYDSLVSRYMTSLNPEMAWPETLTIGTQWDERPLRYGENPHQASARYLDPMNSKFALKPSQFNAGKEISFNNWLDADAAWELVSDLPPGTCAIIKHGNPCGAARGTTLGESYLQAKASDPISAFGGIAAFNGLLDESAVAAMIEKGNFLEVIISNGFENESLLEKFLSGAAWTKNVRFIEGRTAPADSFLTFRSFRGGVLVQESDEGNVLAKWDVVTKKQPSGAEKSALVFLWKIIPHIKSNAIAVGEVNRLLGIGAGQMNRVQSVRLALEQAGVAAKGAVLASDAFFPFPDSIEVAAKAGISAIIQPGGSKKDPEVIQAANELGISMVFTNIRHFRH